MPLLSEQGGSRAGRKKAAYHSQCDTALSNSNNLLTGKKDGRTTLFLSDKLAISKMEAKKWDSATKSCKNVTLATQLRRNKIKAPITSSGERDRM